MKQFIAIILATIVLSVILKDAAIYVLFKVNQDHIAATKCVNKDKKVSKYALPCNGKCFLQKTIAESHEGTEEIPFPVLEDKQDIQQFVQDVTLLLASNTPYKGFTPVLYYNNFHTQSYLQDIFHPPQLG